MELCIVYLRTFTGQVFFFIAFIAILNLFLFSVRVNLCSIIVIGQKLTFPVMIISWHLLHVILDHD